MDCEVSQVPRRLGRQLCNHCGNDIAWIKEIVFVPTWHGRSESIFWNYNVNLVRLDVQVNICNLKPHVQVNVYIDTDSVELLEELRAT